MTIEEQLRRSKRERVDDVMDAVQWDWVKRRLYRHLRTFRLWRLRVTFEWAK